MYSSISLRGPMGVDVVAGEQDAANLLAQRRASGVAADDRVAAWRREPLAEQPQLRALADAVDAVEGKEHGGTRGEERG